LLKVLEERTYTQVGNHRVKRFSGRVIAATNRPVAQLREQGIFREDFFYRLCADCIEVPSLAQRTQENPQELVELVEHFTRVITGQDAPVLCKKAMDVIQNRLGKDYPWPGNVRELAQCIRRVILKDDYQPVAIQPKRRALEIAEGLEQHKYSAEQLLTLYIKMLYENNYSYQDIARIANIDWRTAKKYIDNSP
jgi:DNA-binding NtrC family response regulator